MTLSERNTHIQDLQVKHLAYSSTLINKISYGSTCYFDLTENAKLHYMIKLWYRYNPLTDAQSTSLTDAEQIIALDAQNCISFEEMCAIKKYLIKLMSTCR